ncbi:MAG TPA: GAF domain-containing sensor histidine kinase [Gaiellaceae bacterium]|nr:GAF domain-containing sensor histidine kinase [Gaiellaceae bacterium]
MAARAMMHVNAQANQLALIVDTQQAIATADGSFAELMAIVADRAIQLTGAAAAVVEVPEGDEMVYVAGAGVAAGTEGLRLKLQGSLSGLCVRTCETVISYDTETDDRVDREACRKVGARSMLVVPLREATAEGPAAVKVYSPDAHAFRQQDSHALELMAELAASTMRRTSQVAQLVALDRLKDEIVGVVTHELRNPITSINGYLQLVLAEADNLDPETLGFLRAVERNAARLNALVDDLLTLLHAESGEFDLDMSSIDLAQVALDAIHTVAPLAERNAIQLDVQLQQPTMATADEVRMAQVFDNLLSNAVKYSLEGGPVLIKLGVRNGCAELVVADSGIGIPKEEQQFLFQRFFRASTASKHDIPGTGLGLTIVKTIVEAHGGSIECESACGRGTTFRVRVPVGT